MKSGFRKRMEEVMEARENKKAVHKRDMRVSRKQAQILKKTFKNRFKKLTPDLVNYALNSIGADTEKELANVLGIHTTTLHDWRTGKNEPNGANKVVINFILYSLWYQAGA